MEIPKAYTFDDVLLIPQKSNVLPSYCDTSTQLSNNINLKIPVISAAMDTVSESKLAIAIAQLGGAACLHKNLSIDSQVKEVLKVKKYESGMVFNPITIGPNNSILDVKKIIKEKNISGIPVVNKKNEILGIITNRDLRFSRNDKAKVKDLMTKNVVTIKQGYSSNEAKKLLHKHRIEKIIVTNNKKKCLGLITVKDIEKSEKFPFASKDKKKSLLVGAAVGVGKDGFNRAKALIEANCDFIVVDTAHGHSQSVINIVKKIRLLNNNITLVAGNIATAEAAVELAKLKIDAVKVGIGPGSICTTRVVAGIGYPQFSAILNVKRGLKKFRNVKLIADGGIRYSGDISKAIGAGADAVMIGSLLAGTDETPGEIFFYQGRSFKSYRGMGSISAMARGSADRYFQQDIKDQLKLVPEGVEGRVPYRGPVKNIIDQLVGGLKSSMGYLGAKNLQEFRKNARFVEISNSGIKEGHVHDVQITKQSPNYPVNE
ncbi:MAG: IMP dehydrogenase [Candidatus Pelagibacter sp.]|nr:IMP dehydrogenase [Candidatus Pelagibacter sp.]